MRLRILALSLSIALPALAGDRAPILDRDHEKAQAKHYVLEAQHVLSDAERADLASEGVQVQRALPGGRYLVRVADGSTFDNSDPRVKSLAAMSVTDKLQRSAYRAARNTAFARLHVLFHQDVSIDDAIAAIEAVGGSAEEPLVVRFGMLHSLKARIPSSAITDFAADDRVFKVDGTKMHKAVSYNAQAAALSHVNTIQAASYNLSGAGVVLSIFELAPADPTHPEFSGRFTVHFQCIGASDTQCNRTDYKQHATHVSGTMIAKGLNADAKGMSTEATLHEFRAACPNNDVTSATACGGDWIENKDVTIKTLNSVADNNSWGFTLGWVPEGTTGWSWEEDDELIGGYDDEVSASIDAAAIDSGTLMVHAAGNEGQNSGPTTAPFRHNHVDENFNPTSDVWCYSQDGTGNDCPATSCPGGKARCETTRHPVRSPFGAINWLASEKNVLAVGSVTSEPLISTFTSRGPAKDGRVKPELSAKGQPLFSTFPNGLYGSLQGTSMASPVVSGTIGLFTQQWWKLTGNASVRPSAVMLKAIAIAGADDLGLAGPDATYGFGLLNGKKSVDIMIADNAQGKRIKFDSATQGSQFDYPFTLATAQDLRFVLSWFDPETIVLTSDPTQPVLINDLDLKVVGPTGATTLPYALNKNDPCYTFGSGAVCQPAARAVNVVDNNEEVEIKSAAAGVYHVIVTGSHVVQSPQAFVLVSANADLGAIVPPCTDVTEPNDTADTAYGPLTLSGVVTAAICSDSDVDNFKFTSNAPGTVAVTVTTTDTPVKVTLAGNTINIPANTTQSVSATAGAAPTQFIATVALNGTRGATGVYSIRANFPFAAPAHRRASRH